MTARTVGQDPVLDAAQQALHADPRVGHEAGAISLTRAADGAVVIEGEVSDVAVKRLALERIGSIHGAACLVDRLHVRPSARLSDDEMADHLGELLLQESAFGDCAIAIETDGRRETLHDPGDRASGSLRARVAEGVVVLDGEVPSLSHKRLAGVLAWWVPGSRDVINGLGVEPAQDDSTPELVDAVRLVLEKDPFVDASQVRVSAQASVVTLRGFVASDEQRDMAEKDAWYVFGVDDVDNRIQTQL